MEELRWDGCLVSGLFWFIMRLNNSSALFKFSDIVEDFVESMME